MQRPGGKLLLRASLRAAEVRNHLDEQVIAVTFAGWKIKQMCAAGSRGSGQPGSWIT